MMRPEGGGVATPVVKMRSRKEEGEKMRESV